MKPLPLRSIAAWPFPGFTSLAKIKPNCLNDARQAVHVTYAKAESRLAEQTL